MKIKEFIEKIANNRFVEIGKIIEVKTYLPIQEKQNIAQIIIDECTHNDNGLIKLDSVQQYMSYTKHMILSHTDLEYTDDDYDILCSTMYKNTTVLNALIACFGADAEECSRILNLMLDDKMQENSIGYTVVKVLNSLNDVINSFNASGLKDIIPSDLDINSFNRFLKEYTDWS